MYSSLPFHKNSICSLKTLLDVSSLPLPEYSRIKRILNISTEYTIPAVCRLQREVEHRLQLASQPAQHFSSYFPDNLYCMPLIAFRSVTCSLKGTPRSPPCFLGVNSVLMQWTLTKMPVSRVGSHRKETQFKLCGSCFTCT